MPPFEEDRRWEQRFSNFRKALAKLKEGAEQLANEELQLPDATLDLLIEGLIQRFEFTHELSWNVLKDYANYQGVSSIMGSIDATRYGLKAGLIDDERWMQMIKSRNVTSHCYDESRAREVYQAIADVYLPLMCQLEHRLLQLSTTD